jgi:hypothetical protein
MFWIRAFEILTAPGVVVHELAHAFFCVIFGVRIRKMSLFRFDRVAGYVIHDEPHGFFSNLFICFGPLIINSGLAIWLFRLSSQNIDSNILISIACFWLAIALGLHAIPSTGDAKSLFQCANHNIWRNPLVILFYPLALALYILNLLKRIYLSPIFVALLFYISTKYL